MADDIPAREQDKFVLRLPPGMRERIKSAAEENKRSMNAEILSRLEGSFDAEVDRLLAGPNVHRRIISPPSGAEDPEAILAAIRLILQEDKAAGASANTDDKGSAADEG